MKLYAFSPTYLQLLEAGAFITRLFSDIDGLKTDLGTDKDVLRSYLQLQSESAEYYLSLKPIKAMAESRELVELDLQRDRKMATLRRVIHSFKFSDDKDEQDAYNMAKIILKTFAALEDENYEAESAGIRKFLDEWAKPENAKFAAALNIQPHLKSLEVAADAFDKVFDKRSGTNTQKVVYNSKALKKKMLATYTILIKYVEACALMKEENAFYVSLMNAINNGRHYFANLVARQGGSDAPTDEDEVQ